jgi:hypothetical protein
MAATTTWVWTCTGTRGQAQGFGDPAGMVRPTCTPSTTASWVQVTTQDPTQPWPGGVSSFDVSTLNPADATTAAGAGFVVMGVPLLIAWVVRVIVMSVHKPGA